MLIKYDHAILELFSYTIQLSLSSYICTILRGWSRRTCTYFCNSYRKLFIFWMLSFKPTFSLSSFTFIKRLVGSHQKMIPYVQGQRRSPSKMGLKLNIQKTKIMTSGPITSWQIDGETMETATDFISWAPKSLQMVTAAMKLKDTCSLKERVWPN